jgi:hypothetical protein
MDLSVYTQALRIQWVYAGRTTGDNICKLLLFYFLLLPFINFVTGCHTWREFNIHKSSDRRNLFFLGRHRSSRNFHDIFYDRFPGSPGRKLRRKNRGLLR